MQQITINLAEFLGRPAAITSQDARKLYDLLTENIAGGKFTTISFSGTRHTITAFMNASFGRIMLENPDHDRLFSVTELSPTQNAMYAQVADLVKSRQLNLNKGTLINEQED